MAKKIYIDNNYLVVEDSVSGRIDLSEPKEQIRATVQDGEVEIRLKSDQSFYKEYKYSNVVDINNTDFISEDALNTFFRENTGFNTAPGGSGAASNTLETGSEIDLSNPLGNYCNANSANSSNSFTVINDVNGGWAKILINNTNPPEVIGGSIENGNEFEPNTDMYLVVYSFSGNIKFFYLKVESTFEVVIVPKESEYVDLVGNLDLSQDGAVLITNYGTLEDATWDYEFDHTRDWSLTFKGTESPLGVPRNVQGLDNLQLLNISDDSVIINSSFRTLGQSRQFWSIGGQNIASSDNSFEMNQKLELRNIGGTIAIYNNDSFVANHNNSLTENVRLKLSLDDYNLYDFKFRYL